MFPEAFSSPPTPDVSISNTVYQGWNVSHPRLFFANGYRDPWLAATVSGYNVTLSGMQIGPDGIKVGMSDGYHSSDLITENAAADATVLQVQQEGLSYVTTWLGEWNATSVERRKRSGL